MVDTGNVPSNETPNTMIILDQDLPTWVINREKMGENGIVVRLKQTLPRGNEDICHILPPIMFSWTQKKEPINPKLFALEAYLWIQGDAQFLHQIMELMLVVVFTIKNVSV